MKINLIVNRPVETGQVYHIDRGERPLARGTRVATVEILDSAAAKITEGSFYDRLTILDVNGVKVLSEGVVA
jgi:hypothetical protein